MGKSKSLIAEFQGMRRDRSGMSRSILIDLAPVRTRQDVRDQLTGNSEIASWITGDGGLYLCLDSLDEALPAYTGLPKAISETLKELPLERLSLSVACRAGQFPSYLDEELQSLFGGETSVSRWRLAPLRSRDIELAAVENRLDAKKFLREVSEGGIEALAARPVTLGLLIELAKANSELPKNAWSLYEQGCRHLLADHPESTRPPLLPQVSLEQQMAVAGRIGCVTVLGAFSTISANIANSSQVPALTIADLAGGQERAAGNRFDVNEPEIAGILKTGLFTASGPIFRWCHKSFNEFLAAYYLSANCVPINQVTQLLTCHGRVAPALRGVSAWLSQKDDALFQKILTIDPEALFSGDLRTASDLQKEQLVQWLLVEAENNSPLIREWSLSSSYSSLKHSRLSRQLRMAIEQSQSPIVRHLAVIIARMTRETGLLRQLSDLALDRGQPVWLRSEATAYIASCGNEHEREQLVPLALEPRPQDDEQRLQAAALAAVWPRHCTWMEVRSATVSLDPKTTTSLGRFIAFDFPEKVPEEGLPQILYWLSEFNPSLSELSAWAVATDKLLNRAALSPNANVMQPAIAALLGARLSKHNRLFCRSLPFAKGTQRWPVSARREIAVQLVPHLSSNPNAALGLCEGPNPLFDSYDLEFAADRWRTSSLTERRVWQTIVELLVPWDEEKITDSMLTTLRGQPEMKAAIESLQQRRRRNVELNRLEKAAEDAKKHSKIQERRAELRELLSEAITNTKKFTELLWCASSELSEDSTSGVLKRRVSEFPGWQELTAAEQEQFLMAGKRFIESERPNLLISLRPNTYTRQDHAGYAILRELMASHPSTTRQLPIKAIQTWMPVILLCQCWIPDDKYSLADKGLLGLAAVDAERLGRILAILIRRARTLDLDRQLGRLADISLPDSCNARLLDALRKSPWHGVYLAGMRLLLGHSYGPAVEIVKSIELSSSVRPSQLNLRALNAALWIEQNCQEAWPAVWPLMQNDLQFARDVLDVRIGEEGVTLIEYVAPSLSEGDLKNVFLWLRSQFGAQHLPPIRGGAEWASQHIILNNLKKRGTPAAVVALQEIERQPPSGDAPRQAQDGLEIRHAVWEAERAFIEASWEPLDPATVIRMIEDKRQLLVRDQQELAEAVWSALGDYQKDIRDEGSRVMRLWDENNYRPKPEESLSREIADGIRSFMRGRGVQAQCEPTIRAGQFVDIYVSATTGPKNQISTVIIEVKGCWNKEVKTAQNAQLAMRYLRERSSKDAIYLVAWFLCDRWDETDSRKKRTLRWDVKKAQSFYTKQSEQVNRDTDCSIRAFVLDATLEGKGRPQKRKQSKRVRPPSAHR